MPVLKTKRKVVKIISAKNASDAKSKAMSLYRSGLYGCKVRVVGATLARKTLKPYTVTLELTCTKGKK